MIAFLADAFVKTTVLLVLAAVVTLFLRRAPASLRYLVWTLACGGVLALPLASALLPNWHVAGWPRLDVPVAFNANQIGGALLPATREQTRRVPRQPPAPAVREPAATVPSSTVDAGSMRWRLSPDWTAFVFPGWLGGVAGGLLLLGVGLARRFLFHPVPGPLRD